MSGIIEELTTAMQIAEAVYLGAEIQNSKIDPVDDDELGWYLCDWDNDDPEDSFILLIDFDKYRYRAIWRNNHV